MILKKKATHCAEVTIIKTLNVIFPNNMSLSPNSSVFNQTIELNYANRKRSSSLKWLVVNIVVLLVFVYDLSYKCAGYTSALHWAEACCACVLCANVLQHGVRVVRSGRVPGPAPRPPRPARSRPGAEPPDSCSALTLSPVRAWRGADASPPSSPSSPSSPPSPGRSPVSPRLDTSGATDEFIADRRSLADYLREHEVRGRAEVVSGPSAGWGPARLPAAPYQLACGAPEEGAGEEPGEAAAGAWRPAGARLPEPARLTQWNQNLRVWLHLTVLRPLVAEMERVDAALQHLGLGDARLGHVGLERLQKLPSPGALLPYLEAFPDQRYVVQRIRELAGGAGLSAYRWCGGGSAWEAGKPTDAELLLALLGAYLDSALPGAPRQRPFSTRHVTAAPDAPPRHAGALAIHRARSRPPHYVLALGEDTVEVSPGRNNLLHTLLLFLAAAAREQPPVLQRVHLGPAGLNMLWIIGR